MHGVGVEERLAPFYKSTVAEAVELPCQDRSPPAHEEELAPPRQPPHLVGQEQPSAEAAPHLRTYLSERMVVQEEGRFVKTGRKPYF